MSTRAEERGQCVVNIYTGPHAKWKVRPVAAGGGEVDERSVMKEGHSLAVGPGPNKRGERLPSGAERLLTND